MYTYAGLALSVITCKHRCLHYQLPVYVSGSCINSTFLAELRQRKLIHTGTDGQTQVLFCLSVDREETPVVNHVFKLYAEAQKLPQTLLSVQLLLPLITLCFYKCTAYSSSMLSQKSTEGAKNTSMGQCHHRSSCSNETEGDDLDRKPTLRGQRFNTPSLSAICPLYPAQERWKLRIHRTESRGKQRWTV